MRYIRVTSNYFSDSYNESLVLTNSYCNFLKNDLQSRLRYGYEEMSFINLGIAEEFISLEDEVSLEINGARIEGE